MDTIGPDYQFCYKKTIADWLKNQLDTMAPDWLISDGL
jgi:hypothetical protein